MVHQTRWLLVVSLAVGLCSGSVAPAQQRKGTAVGGLRLEVAKLPEKVASGHDMELVVRFVNDADQPLACWVETGHLPTFLGWTMVRADGVRFEPTHVPVQTMWAKGVDGDLFHLAPGQSHVYRDTVRLFVPTTDTRPQGLTDRARPLPAGRYTFECRYARPDRKVRYCGEAFSYYTEEVADLWTGTVTADPQSFEVEVVDPAIDVKVQASVVLGDPLPVRIEVSNPTDRPLVLTQALRVSVASKAAGVGFARITDVDGEGRVLADGAPAPEFVVAPHGTRVVAVDLARLPFVGRFGPGAPQGLYELVRQGLFVIDVSFGTDRAMELAAWGDFVRVEPRAVTPAAGLKLTIAGAPERGRCTIELRNVSDHPLRVCRRLAIPEDLFFTIYDPAAAPGDAAGITRTAPSTPEALTDFVEMPTSARLVAGRNWNGDAFDPRRPLAATDFVMLAPGEVLRREVEIEKLVMDGLAPGNYRVMAFWRCLEPGFRFGLDAPLPVNGAATSEPIPWTVGSAR